MVVYLLNITVDWILHFISIHGVARYFLLTRGTKELYFFYSYHSNSEKRV